MIQKFQLGGSTSQPDEQERFTAYLIDKLNPKDSKDFEDIISSYTEKELNQLYKQFKAMEGSLFARNGAKIDYLTRLNGKCPEGYEIEKFSIGGCAKCKKKHALLFEPGGEVKKRFSQNPDMLKCGKKVKKHNCGGKTKKRISKKENGAAFRKVNGGPGSIDSTRDMKPNKKQRKMIKKHQDGTNRGGVTFREDLNPPTQGVIGELGRNVQQGANLFERMTRMPRRVVATAVGARYAPTAAKTVVNSSAAKAAGDKAWKAVAATGPVGILGAPTMAMYASGFSDALNNTVWTGGNTDKGISNWTKENIVTPAKNGAVSYWNWMTGMTK